MWAPAHSPSTRQHPWAGAGACCLPEVPSSSANSGGEPPQCREDTSRVGLQLKPRRAMGPKSRLPWPNKILAVGESLTRGAQRQPSSKARPACPDLAASHTKAQPPAHAPLPWVCSPGLLPPYPCHEGSQEQEARAPCCSRGCAAGKRFPRPASHSWPGTFEQRWSLGGLFQQKMPGPHVSTLIMQPGALVSYAAT